MSTSEPQKSKASNDQTYQFGVGVLERRAIIYIIDELDAGRQLFEILSDPYIKNRIDPTKIQLLLSDQNLLEAFKAEIDKAREGLQ